MISIIEFTPGEHDDLLPKCRDLHVSVVESDGTMARYLPPFTEEKKKQMFDWYLKHRQKVVENEQHNKNEVAGIVMLMKPQAETGPMRGGVELLLVSAAHRQQGISRKLMAKLEDVARSEGRTLLTLATTEGTPAEKVYLRLGYTEFGRVPGDGFHPARKNVLSASVHFYKDLSKTTPMIPS